MNSSHNGYRHAKHDAIVRLLREGRTDKGIASELKVDRRAAARVRRMLGMGPRTNATTAGDKLDRFSTEQDVDGHVTWTGRRSRSGTPQIRHLGKEIPAAAVAFIRRTGRPPVGSVRSDCGTLHCVAPAHVLDDVERRAVRMHERALYGLEPQPWTECPQGHGWDAHGRVEPDLTPYCRACNTDRARRVQLARTDERNES